MAKEARKYADRRPYLVAAVQKRRKKIRQMALADMGGRCHRCGYHRCAEALEFHHVGSTGKDFSISEKGHSRSWARVQDELKKCVLLCANCHREVHSGFQSVSR